MCLQWTMGKSVTVTVTVTGDSDNSESEHGSVVKKIKDKSERVDLKRFLLLLDYASSYLFFPFLFLRTRRRRVMQCSEFVQSGMHKMNVTRW